jgi:small subunit ribosomal protein S17
MAEDKNTDIDQAPAAPEAETHAVVDATEAVVEAQAPPEESPEEASPAVTEAPAEAEPAPAPTQSGPKKKFKRLPRSERPKKTRVKRPAPTGERKPISREPKPEHDRGRRQERRGVVVSDAMDKTIVVKVDTIRAHPRYKKVIRRSAKFHAHDEQNSAHVGDLVRIVETRPLSKTKNWRLAEIVEAAK